MMKPRGVDMAAAIERFEKDSNSAPLSEWGSDEWFLSDMVHGKLVPSAVYSDRKQSVVNSMLNPSYGYDEIFFVLPSCWVKPCSVTSIPVKFTDLLGVLKK
jgi:hypothetical protein